MNIILTDQFTPSTYVVKAIYQATFLSTFAFEEISENDVKTLLSLADVIMNDIHQNPKELFLSIRLDRRFENCEKTIDTKDAIIIFAEFEFMPWTFTVTEALEKKITWWKITYVD